MNRKRPSPASRVALLYAATALAWIVGSDYVLEQVTGAPHEITIVSVVKGLGFVLVTGLLLFWYLRRLWGKELAARAATEETARELRELLTEREKGQAALRQSEERFRRLAETISEVFWMTSLDLSRIQYISPAYERVWGRTCESLYEDPKSWAEAIHPEDRAAVWAAFANDRENEKTAEYRIVRPDGTVRWVLDRAFPWRNDAGELAGIVGIAKDVTERKLAEQAVRESEEKLRALYQSMNEGLALHELIQDASGRPVDYRILDVNPAFESMVGVSREAVVGGLGSVVYGTQQPPGLEVYAQVGASGQPTTFETYFAPKDKHFSVSVFSPGKGQFATVFTDITKRKEAERQICLLNQVYSLLSHINEAIVRASDQATLFQEACRIATEQGQFRMAWIGVLDEASSEVRPVAWAGYEEGYLKAIAVSSEGGGPTATAIREQRVVLCSDIAADPQMAPWREAALARGYRSSLALPLKLGAKVIGAFSVYAEAPNFFNAIMTESLIEVAADLSFALELFERNRQRELEQQQVRLQHSALEAAANAILITGRNGKIQWVNEAFTRLTGHTREEIIGQTPRLFRSGVHNNDFYQQIWQTVLGGAVWQGELTNRRKDGSLYEEEMTITPVRSGDGQVSHFIAIKQDVTERRKLEQQFLRAQRMQSIGLLAGGVAHDLNNVLAPVLMALPLLRTNPTPEQRDHILDTLEKSVQRGANIVQQVLTFARGVEVQRTAVQLRHLIREVAKIAEETFPRDIDVRSSVSSELWPLMGDPTQIHQVLLNLAVNARDAMPGGGQLTLAARNVELRAPLHYMDFEIPPGRYVSVSVADTGTGIEPKVLERMFEPFFTTKPAGKGTGLGLSTVLGIVKSHGGLVEVQTKMGAGATFTVYLPATSTAAPVNLPARSRLPQGRGETILVVDDEAGILQVTRSMLLGNGYKVVTAREGMQALARYTEHRHGISAVVTDIMMPFMDGLALTTELRQMNGSLPVVVTTGLTNPPGEADRADQLRALGVSHILRKPFAAEELLKALREVLDGSHSR
jgi:PAS domain S-box-containing protein